MKQAKKIRRSKRHRIAITILAAIISIILYEWVTSPESKHFLSRESAGEMMPGLSSNTSDSPVSISANSLYSPNAILVCLNDDVILMEKSSQQRIYPASLTKIMTAIVAIENVPDLQEEVFLPGELFTGLYQEDAAMAGFEPDEQVRAIDLVYGILLPSGAECCLGLANQIAGSEPDFVRMMNEKAAEIGMHNTHFTNVTGLHEEDHYTTVQDLAILLGYALQNDTFREVFTSNRYFTQSTNIHPGGISFGSTMFGKINDPGINGGSILGGKTGYTDEAGLCLASLAKVDGKEYILVTAGARGNHKSEQYNIRDAFTVYNRISQE